MQKNIVRASTTKRAQARRKQLEKIDRLEKPNASNKRAQMTFHAEKPSGNQVLNVQQAAIGYHQQILSEPIDFEVQKWDAIAIVGPNGIGKSTLIKSIVKQIPFIKGEIKYGANLEMGYYDQTQSRLTKTNSVLDELWNAFPTTPELDIRKRLGAFLFSGDDVKKSVSVLSGGERARLLLAKLSMENNNFLVLDEPTNHLDIDSKEVLENALIDYDGTLLFVSHDRYFINRVASKVLEITETGSHLYLGDYDYYIEKKAELEELARLTQTTTDPLVTDPSLPNTDYQKQKENQKEVRRLSRRLAEIENRLEVIDINMAAISEKMVATNDPGLLMDCQKELDQYELEQQTLMDQWEEIGTQLDL